MIEVTLIGVDQSRFTRAMKADEFGTVRFNLADDHDLVDLFGKLNNLLGLQPPAIDERHDAMMKLRAMRAAEAKAKR